MIDYLINLSVSEFSKWQIHVMENKFLFQYFVNNLYSLIMLGAPSFIIEIQCSGFI